MRETFPEKEKYQVDAGKVTCFKSNLPDGPNLFPFQFHQYYLSRIFHELKGRPGNIIDKKFNAAC